MRNFLRTAIIAFPLLVPTLGWTVSPELLLLSHGRMRRHFPSDRIHARRDHHGGLRSFERGEIVQHVADHAAPGDPVQHLRQRGLHSRALTGREDDNEQGWAAHRALGVIDDGHAVEWR